MSKRLLLYAFACRLVAVLEARPFYNTIDFSPFETYVSEVARRTPPSDACVRPPGGGVTLTFTTSNFASYMALQREAAQVHGAESAACILRYHITVCLDGSACLNACEAHKLTNCAILKNATILEESPFFGKDYAYMNYLKFVILKHALYATPNAAMIDADVVMFRPLWTALDASSYETYDVRFQHEAGNGSCAGTKPNAGQVIVTTGRNASAVAAFFADFESHKDAMVAAQTLDQSDQPQMWNSLWASGASFCALDYGRVVGGCSWSRDGGAPVGRTVSFHPSCWGQDKKQALLQKYVFAVRDKANKTIEESVFA